MACVEMEGRSIPLDDATVRAHDHAAEEEQSGSNTEQPIKVGATLPLGDQDLCAGIRAKAHSESCFDLLGHKSSGGSAKPLSTPGFPSDTEPRRDTLLERVHENAGPRAHDRSNSHVFGGVPLKFKTPITCT